MTILYVDDDAEDREFFHDIVQSMDPSLMCYTAGSGREALKKLEEMIMPPDVIVLDINMPVMDGKELLVAIKKLPRLRSVPVTMYSTTSHPGERNEYLQLGACQVLVKPSTLENARVLISSIVRQQ